MRLKNWLMAKRAFHQELLGSDEFARYSLRATCFVRRLRSLRLWDAIGDVHHLNRAKNGFVWTSRSEWGIDEEAWAYAQRKEIEPLLVFAQPRVLSEQPRLLLYYRTINLLSQKGLGTLVGGNVAAIELGKVTALDSAWVDKAVIALNSIASVIINNSADVEPRDLPGFQFASAGATIQGSWNNAIGDEGEIAVRTILANHTRTKINQLVWRDG